MVELQQSGFEVIIADNLCNSNIGVLDGIEQITGIRPAFEQIDLADEKQTRDFFSRHRDVEAAGSRMDVTDGIKIILNDGWALIRASTTEPCIRVYSESMDAGTADRILSEYSRMVKDLVRGLTDASRAQPEPR